MISQGQISVKFPYFLACALPQKFSHRIDTSHDSYYAQPLCSTRALVLELKENLQNVNTDFTSSVLNLYERALAKMKDLQKQGSLVYSKYTAQELEEAINKQAIPPADNAPSHFKLNLMRSAV